MGAKTGSKCADELPYRLRIVGGEKASIEINTRYVWVSAISPSEKDRHHLKQELPNETPFQSELVDQAAGIETRQTLAKNTIDSTRRQY